MAYTNHRWWFGGWFIIVIPTWNGIITAATYTMYVVLSFMSHNCLKATYRSSGSKPGVWSFRGPPHVCLAHFHSPRAVASLHIARFGYAKCRCTVLCFFPHTSALQAFCWFHQNLISYYISEWPCLDFKVYYIHIIVINYVFHIIYDIYIILYV